MMPKQVIKLPGVVKTTGLSKSTIYKLISEGKFPKNIPLTGKSTGWIDEEIQSWIDERIAASRNGEAA
jgi:prophage regulatory protein